MDVKTERIFSYLDFTQIQDLFNWLEASLNFIFDGQWVVFNDDDDDDNNNNNN